MDRFQCIEHLRQQVEHFLLTDGALGFQTGSQRFAIDEVHGIVAGAVLLKQIVHLNNMVVFQTAQTLSLFLELRQLLVILHAVGLVAHADGMVVSLALVDAADKELLNGIVLVELCVPGLIGISETAGCQLFFNDIDATKRSADR